MASKRIPSRGLTSAAWRTLMTEYDLAFDMGVVDSHETGSEDDEDPERSVRVIEGHAVQFNEYRY
ncbi:hypothetical protein JCM31271_08200 [Halorubrum trueperi]